MCITYILVSDTFPGKLRSCKQILFKFFCKTINFIARTKNWNTFIVLYHQYLCIFKITRHFENNWFFIYSKQLVLLKIFSIIYQPYKLQSWIQIPWQLQRMLQLQRRFNKRESHSDSLYKSRKYQDSQQCSAIPGHVKSSFGKQSFETKESCR